MFSPPDYLKYEELQVTYLNEIILLSILVVGFASYTTLSLYDRMQKPSVFKRNVWIALTSLSMAFGIWAMHYGLMNAITFPLAVHVDYTISLLSIVPAFIASLLAFRLVDGPMKSCWRHPIATALLMVGMMATHFIGVKSIKVDVLLVYNWQLLLAANIIGGLFIDLTLRLITHLHRSLLNRWLAVVLLTFGSSTMHYVGMVSTKFYINVEQPFAETVVNHMDFLNSLIGVGIVALLVGMLLTTYVDDYVDDWMQNFDMLTKLPNRRSWEHHVIDEVATGDIAIWNFPNIQRLNKVYGYQAGDEFLLQVAEVLNQWKPNYVQLYRVGGNRFLFYVHQAGRTEDIYKDLIIIAGQLDRLPLIKSKDIRYICGLAKADQQKTVRQLYKESMRVVEQAADAREWGLVTFNPAIHGVSHEQDVLRDITKAMEENQLYLVYQPKVKGDNQKLVSVEALLRWDHPELGSIAPYIFVPILERDGRMGEVTDWIVREVCKQIQEWDQSNICIPQVAINIPGEYVADSRLLDRLYRETNFYRIEPNRIELEITETSTAKSVEQAVAAIKRFKRYGFSVALDDFGTGVSSLSYLQQLPITTLKIDKSFADGVPGSQKECAVLNAILTIGQSMDLQMIVEGVEKKEQVDFLLDLQPNLIFQGYYFAKPMLPEKLVGWIAGSKEYQQVHLVSR
ncbi:EAL domain-containing protein [Sporosarcina sp. GW1-11]|uniref:bifunctional diguanylate cyclase/phosphodiesterase n=1 Tax=Sporosarcina sp. GW1-11 TaxID=2899126 RepID=UPI00294EB1DF|nr:EAL domain-containing protein [Sporosarcina sp. GW1-11]MDV6378867.1 EAL domain-containing protein [Sporosarcina sp. GW1-11]